MFPLILRDQLRIAHFIICVLFITIWGIFLLIRGDAEPHPHSTVLLSSPPPSPTTTAAATTTIDQKKENMDVKGVTTGDPKPVLAATPVSSSSSSSNGKERMFHKIFHSHEYLHQIDESHNGNNNPITYEYPMPNNTHTHIYYKDTI